MHALVALGLLGSGHHSAAQHNGIPATQLEAGSFVRTKNIKDLIQLHLRPY